MKTSGLYILAMTFIIGWWMMAFHHSTPQYSHLTSPSYQIETNELLSHLSPIQRDVLRKALAGNTQLMLPLMNQWEADAEILAKKGINVEKISCEKLLKATIISQLIHDSSPQELQRMNNELRTKWIIDDCGVPISATKSNPRLLPQTDMAAGFLLALCDPKELAALPKGILQSSLYACEKSSLIQMCAPKLRSEQLHLLNLDVACLAYYTHPSTKELYNHLSIPVYITKSLDSIDEIQNTLLKLGHLSNHPLEATLLSIFIDSALIAIDNRIAALSQVPSLKSIIYLYHHHHFMVPTTKCLSGQLMARAMTKYPGLSCPIPFHESHWRLPIAQESIIQSKPDCLLLASPHSPNIEMLKDTPIFLLDEYVQESPNQYIVLAYFDIFQALAAAHNL